MGMDGVLMAQAAREAELREHDRAEARLVVAGLSHDVDDCAFLLTVLGLMD